MPDQRIVYCYEMYSASERMSVSVGTVEFGAAGDGTKLTYTEQAWPAKTSSRSTG